MNLRGLGTGATLVLVNGRRQPYSGTEADFVDLSGIPWSAVDRIEVLPDGASALYGSDAIAGVVNVIMRKDLDGAETQVRFGTAPGGAEERLVAQLFGTRWNSGNVLFAYQFSDRGALDASARAYTATSDKTSSRRHGSSKHVQQPGQHSRSAHVPARVCDSADSERRDADGERSASPASSICRTSIRGVADPAGAARCTAPS